MDVNNYLSSIPIAKNMISEAPKGPLTQAAAGTGGSSTAPGTDISGISTLKSYDFAARQGYREDYSVWDAADSLWKQETQTFNLKDLDDPEKSRSSWRTGASRPDGTWASRAAGPPRKRSSPITSRACGRTGWTAP